MKTLREYIDQLDEISRRDFLKGAGAMAAGAALGKAGTAAAGGPYYISVPVPSGVATDPPLPRTKSLKPVWKYYNVDVLSEEDRKAISRLIRLMYIARMTPDDYRDSQGGRIQGGVTPSKLYKDAYELLIFINDSFMNLNVGGAMNTVKKQFDDMQKNNPEELQKWRNFYFGKWEEIILRGNLIKQALSKEQPSSEEKPKAAEPTSTNTGPIKSGFEGKVLDTGMILFVLASKGNHESLPAIKSALNNYAAKTGLSKEMNDRIKEISADPMKFGPSTRPEQYLNQSSQIINNINDLVKSVKEDVEPEDPIAKVDKLFRNAR